VNPADFGVTLVMHGFQLGGCPLSVGTSSYDTTEVPLHEIADAILERAGSGEIWVWDAANDAFWFHRSMGTGGGERIILVDWACASNNTSPGHAESTAHALYAALKTFNGTGTFGSVSDGVISQLLTTGKRLHVVAHSFGTVVGFEFLRRVRHLEGIQNIQFTTLDPHDFNQLLTSVDGSTKHPNIDINRLGLAAESPPVSRFDNYYQETTTVVPHGRCIAGSANRFLSKEESGIAVNLSDPLPLLEYTGINHTGVWHRYLHTILPDSGSIDGIYWSSNSFTPMEDWKSGYNYSKIGGLAPMPPSTGCSGEAFQQPEADDVEVMNASDTGSGQTWWGATQRYLFEQGGIFDGKFLGELDDSSFRPGFAHATATTLQMVTLQGIRYAMLASYGKILGLKGTTSFSMPASILETHATYIPPTTNSLQFKMNFSTGSTPGAVTNVISGLSTFGNIPYNGSPAGNLRISFAQPIWASATRLVPSYDQIATLSLESFPNNAPGAVCVDIPQGHRDSTRTIKFEVDAMRVAFIRDFRFSPDACAPSLTVSSNSAGVPTGGVAIALSSAATDGATSLTTNAATPAYKVFGRGSSVTLTAPAFDAAGSPFSNWAYCDGTPGPRQCTVLLNGHRGVELSYTPSAELTTNGFCGSASGMLSVSAPSHSFCLPATTSAVVTTADNYSWTCPGTNGGQPANCQAARAYVVTPTAGANGTISPNMLMATRYGLSQAFTVTPNAGFVAQASGCGGTLVGGIYTTGPITGTCAVSVVFSQSSVNPPTAPTIGTTTADSGSISVAFTPGAIGSGTLINYTADCGGIANTGNSSPITVSGLTNGTAYTCKVKTTSTVGESSWSSASTPVTPVGGAINGTCGSAAGVAVSVAPTTNLCSTGTVSAFSGTGPWNWTCSGTGGGTPANCSAALASSASVSIVAEGFEGGAATVLDPYPGHPALTVTNAVAALGTYSAHPTSDMGLLKKEFTPISSGKVEMSCRMSLQGTETNSFVRCAMGSAFRQEDQVGQAQLQIGIFNNAIFVGGWENGTSFQSLNVLPAVVGQWYRLSVVYDFASGLATFSVDGNVVSQRNIAIGALTYLWVGDDASISGMGGGNESVADNIYVDDVRVTAIPAAATGGAPTAGLVGYYPFADNANDISGSGRHGTVSGAPTFVAQGSSTALRLDGVDDWVELPDPGFLRSVTVSARISHDAASIPRNSGGYKWYGIVDAWTGFENFALMLWEQAPGDLRLRAQIHDRISGNALYPEIWAMPPAAQIRNTSYHVVMTYDNQSKALNMYLDGALVGTATTPDSTYCCVTEVAPDLRIGLSRDGNYFPGTIGQVRIYNRALTGAEVQQLVTSDGGTRTTHSLTVTRNGAGTGSVASSSPGIDCGSDCSEGYVNGIGVTLAATPASGSVFAGWSGGGCSGMATCTVTMDTAKGVTASFALAAPALTLTPTSVSFADQALGSSSGAQTVSLTNSGNSSLSIGSITISGDYSKVSTCTTSLAPGAACTIAVTFSPAATGARTGAISISSNSSGSPHSVSLGGSGTLPVLNIPLTLTQGWNLLGNSLNQPLSVATPFGDPAVVSTVWKWENTGSRWLFFTPMLDAAALQTYATSKGYGVLSQVGPGEGYWVNAKIAVELAAQAGQPFVLTGANLTTGWNLVATGQDVSPATFNRSLSETPPSPGVVPQNLTSLWAWDNPANGWYFYAPGLEAQGGTALTDYITSKGYRDFTQHNKRLGNGTGFWVRRP
jgi:hypothetical protein